eukprot:5603761-Ditylum_brightwellii.AAC.1
MATNMYGMNPVTRSHMKMRKRKAQRMDAVEYNVEKQEKKKQVQQLGTKRSSPINHRQNSAT